MGPVETADILLVLVTTLALLGPFVIVFQTFSVEEQHRIETLIGFIVLWLVLTCVGFLLFAGLLVPHR